jgi:hypothetical protein
LVFVFDWKSKAFAQFLVVLFLVCTQQAFARNKRKVPLLPPKPASIDEVVTEVPAKKESDFDLFSIGVEGATVGRTSVAGIYGSQAYFGGRAFFTLGLSENWSVKASLGYMGQLGSTVYVPAMEQDLETGLIIRYNLYKDRGLTWWGGLSQRLDYALNAGTLAVYSSTNYLAATPQFIYRAGPATGIAVHLLPEWDFVTEIEATFSATEPVRSYGGLSAGIVYHLF